MLKTAARVWGLPGIEDETSFDPLVEMLIKACSAEIERISSEVHISQARLLQRLAQILTPDTETGAVPAHTILSATPTEPQATLNQEQKFALFRKINASDTVNKDIYFNPTSHFKLFSGEVKYLVVKDSAYQITDNRYKEIIANFPINKSLNSSTLFVGLDLDKEIKHAQDLTIYFDIKNESKKDLFYHYLQLSKWKVNERHIDTHPGYGSGISKETIDIDSILYKNFRLSDNTSKKINDFYERRFMNIKSLDLSPSNYSRYPKAFENTLEPRVLEKFTTELLWIQIDFPEIITGELLKDVTCSLNCFPAFNRRLNHLTYRMEPTLNIIPLKSDEYFFDVKSVTDTEGVQHHIKNTDGKFDINEGDILLRTSGVGRFDAREASELLQHLAEAMRDESASFSIFGGPSISNSITDLNKAISNLQDRIAKGALNESISYLVVKNNLISKNLFIDFWSTNGTAANNIKPGTLLESTNEVSLKNKVGTVMTVTVGGKDRLSDEEKLTAFKKHFISRDKIVTIEDIKAYCTDFFGSRISKLEIKKGFDHDISRSSGLRRVLNIHIKRNTEFFTSDEEWDYLFETISMKLNKSSSNLSKFRVILENEVP